MSNVIPFPDRRPPNPNGSVEIFPCALHSGSWGVEHVSAVRDSAVFVAAWIDFDEASRAAARYARELGADFEDGDAA